MSIQIEEFKRYTLYQKFYSSLMEEDIYGEWVTYEEAQNKVDSLRKELRIVREDRDNKLREVFVTNIQLESALREIKKAKIIFIICFVGWLVYKVVPFILNLLG